MAMNTPRFKQGAPEWAYLGKVQPSEIGKVTLEILNIVFSGLHHLDSRLFKKVDWTDPYGIVLTFQNQEFSTFDFNRLTLLVILAHDACVRLSISSSAMKTMQLMFSPRIREGAMHERHPSIEDAITQCRAHYSILP